MLQVGGKLLHSLSIPFVELIVTWLGVCALVYEFHAINIWVKGDTTTVILWLHNTTNPKYSYILLLQDLRHWQLNSQYVKISHIYQKANQEDDHLARKLLLVISFGIPYRMLTCMADSFFR